MHTDSTLEILDLETIRIGRELRAFVKKTCTSFKTKELKRETAARRRRQLKKLTQSGQIPQETTSAAICPSKATKGCLPKTFNLQTIKLHFLGDHADTIREFGTNDSHSTEPVSYLFSCSGQTFWMLKPTIGGTGTSHFQISLSSNKSQVLCQAASWHRPSDNPPSSNSRTPVTNLAVRQWKSAQNVWGASSYWCFGKPLWPHWQFLA